MPLILCRDWKRPVLNNNFIHTLTLLLAFLSKKASSTNALQYSKTTASNIREIKTRRKQFVKMHHSREMEDKGLQNAGEQGKSANNCGKLDHGI